VFVIILSFFLALYLPITAFANGAKLRLVHVGELESCIVFESWPLLLPWSMPMDKRYRELMHAQMAQVNVSNLCSDPMVLQFRAQVTNPAHVHVDVSKLQVVLKKGSQKLMDLSIPEPLAVPSLVENQDIPMTISIDVLDEEAASAALVDLQANKYRPRHPHHCNPCPLRVYRFDGSGRHDEQR